MKSQKTDLDVVGIMRRKILLASGTTALGLAAGIAPSFARTAGSQEPVASQKFKALLFDVQGTIVDFYSTIVREGEKFTKARGIDADWTTLTKDWRAGYRKGLDGVMSGKVTWRSTDVIYREALDTVLDGYPWGGKLSAAERDELNGLWSRLDPWPDTVAGLTRLRRKFTLSALSNGSMASVVGIAKHGGLPFDCVLTAELVRSSKPDPKVYELAVNSLQLKPDQLLMVACHKYDLAAAKKLGFNVAFVQRPLEFGPGGEADTAPEDYFDFVVKDLESLADTLGA